MAVTLQVEVTRHASMLTGVPTSYPSLSFFVKSAYETFPVLLRKNIRRVPSSNSMISFSEEKETPFSWFGISAVRCQVTPLSLEYIRLAFSALPFSPFPW